MIAFILKKLESDVFILFDEKNPFAVELKTKLKKQRWQNKGNTYCYIEAKRIRLYCNSLPAMKFYSAIFYFA